MTSSTPRTNRGGIEIHFDSAPTNLAPIRACVERFAHAVGFDDELAGRIALAVDEAIANVIRHGYEGRTDGPVLLRLAPLEEGGLRVDLEDEGNHFDPCRIDPRDLSEVRPGGLGLHIIRSTFARCAWRRRDEAGMHLSLELPLHHTGPALPLSTDARPR